VWHPFQQNVEHAQQPPLGAKHALPFNASRSTCYPIILRHVLQAVSAILVEQHMLTNKQKTPWHTTQNEKPLQINSQAQSARSSGFQTSVTVRVNTGLQATTTCCHSSCCRRIAEGKLLLNGERRLFPRAAESAEFLFAWAVSKPGAATHQR